MMKKVFIFIFVFIILFVVFYDNLSKPKQKSLGELFLPNIMRAETETKILFVGDMFFDRYIRQVGDERGGDFIFSCKDFNDVSLSDFLKNADVVVGNLEGPITDNASISLGTEPGGVNNFTFTFPPRTAKLLAKNNIKLVNLGNNHIANFGKEGIVSTKKYLDEANVKYFGQPHEDLGENEYAKWGSISFISYNEFALPAEALAKAGRESVEKIIQNIKTEKNNGQKVIVYAHWGDEYTEAPERVKNIAKLFADSGADLIVGSHPHIILSSENIGDTVVYYSLGNFIFDQYWDKSVSTGLILEVNIKSGNINIIEHQVSLNRDGRTCLVNFE